MIIINCVYYITNASERANGGITARLHHAGYITSGTYFQRPGLRGEGLFPDSIESGGHQQVDLGQKV